MENEKVVVSKDEVYASIDEKVKALVEELSVLNLSDDEFVKDHVQESAHNFVLAFEALFRAVDTFYGDEE